MRLYQVLSYKCNNAEIMNMILSLCRWIIWKRRCIQKYERKYIDICDLKKWVKSEIKKHTYNLLNGKFIHKKPALKRKLESLMVLIKL